MESNDPYKIDLRQKAWKTSANYNISIVVDAAFPKPARNNLGFNMQIMCEKTEEGLFAYRFQKSGMKLNDNKGSSVFNDINNRLAGVLNRLEFSVNDSGDLLGIRNYKFILKEWQSIKKEVKKKYSGDKVYDLVNIMDAHISNPESILFFIRRDPFYNVWFNNYYRMYYVWGWNKDETYAFNFFGGKDIPFLEERTIEDHADFYKMSVSGADLLSVEEKHRILEHMKHRRWIEPDQKKDIKGELNGKADFDKNTGRILDLEITRTLKFGRTDIKKLYINIRSK